MRMKPAKMEPIASESASSSLSAVATAHGFISPDDLDDVEEQPEDAENEHQQGMIEFKN